MAFSSDPRAQGPQGSQGQFSQGSNTPNPAERARSYIKSTYQRDVSDDELSGMAQHIGYTGGDFTPYEQRAKKLIDDHYGGSRQSLGGTPAAPPGARPQVNRDGSIPDPVVAPQLPKGEMPGYNAQPVSNPVDPQAAAAHNQLLMKVLQQPESLSPGVIGGMKEAQKESNLSILSQLRGQNAESAAASGRFGGGYQAVQDRGAADAATAGITKAYRDIDASAAQQNFNDRLAALGLADQVQQGQFSRGMGVNAYNQGERQYAHGAQKNQVSFALEQALGQAGLDLGAAGLNMDRARLQEMGRQYDLAHQGSPLQWVQALNDMVMGRANYGLNLAQLQQMMQSGMFANLFPR